MKNKIIVALDSSNLENSIKLVRELKKYAFAFKIGYEFFYNFGNHGYNLVRNEKVKIFLDLKLYDIPNTIKNAVAALTKLEPYFLTIHISGGDDMLKKANLSKKDIKILGVSILTSIEPDTAKKFYFNPDIKNIVFNFSNYAVENNLDGIVCSPNEIQQIKKNTKNKLLIITPGIRPLDFKVHNDDQARTMTPKEAIMAGADYLVIGRPITQSNNPLQTLQTINFSLE
jgi:orotidine-5'-phosphate decarboxylase